MPPHLIVIRADPQVNPCLLFILQPVPTRGSGHRCQAKPYTEQSFPSTWATTDHCRPGTPGPVTASRRTARAHSLSMTHSSPSTTCCPRRHHLSLHRRSPHHRLTVAVSLPLPSTPNRDTRELGLVPGNSCSGHRAARIGWQRRRRADEE
jgi:hypothetical protein